MGSFTTRCTLQKVARTGVGATGPTFTSWLTDLDDTLYLRVIDARKKAGLDATISQDEYDALCIIDSRMIREARASWPNGRERVEMNGHHVLLWPLENGWWLADAPDFPDSWLQGETKQEALELIQDAMAYEEAARKRVVASVRH